MMDIFFEFNETGKLVIERILFSANYPVLFTCINERKELYLCVCCQANQEGKKWLLAETVPDVIVQMLENRITIRDAFLKADRKKFTIISDGQARLFDNDKEDWNGRTSIDLPDDEYIDAEEGEFCEEINFYKAKSKKEGLRLSAMDIFTSYSYEFSQRISMEDAGKESYAEKYENGGDPLKIQLAGSLNYCTHGASRNICTLEAGGLHPIKCKNENIRNYAA